MLKEKIKLIAIVGLLMILFNCCASSFMTYGVSVEEVTGVIRVESVPNDSTLVQFWK